MIRIITRIWAFLTSGEYIILEDFDETITYSIARKFSDVNLIAKRHWPWNINNVILHPDGSVVSLEGSSYVTKWRRVNGKSS